MLQILLYTFFLQDTIKRVLLKQSNINPLPREKHVELHDTVESQRDSNGNLKF